jgi:hypothetical protein
LLSSLLNYFKDDKERADDISNFIMDSREEKEKESIKRKLQK